MLMTSSSITSMNTMNNHSHIIPPPYKKPRLSMNVSNNNQYQNKIAIESLSSTIMDHPSSPLILETDSESEMEITIKIVIKNNKKKKKNNQRHHNQNRNNQKPSETEIEEKMNSKSFSKMFTFDNIEIRDEYKNTEKQEMCSSTPEIHANASPIRSCLHLKRMDNHSKSVHFNTVSIRTFEQRSGLLSSAVPNDSPSLYLGQLMTECELKINDYNKIEKHRMLFPLSSKQRKNRVKQFSPSDVSRNNLKLEKREILKIVKSRENVGCECTSIYLQKKAELIENIIFLSNKQSIDDDDDESMIDEKKQRKILSKMRKNQLLKKLQIMEFSHFGRYDVCCVDERCMCYANGFACHQIEHSVCKCGGKSIYSNIIQDVNHDIQACKKKKYTKAKKRSKKDSFCCGNKYGNNYHQNVMDFCISNDDDQHYSNSSSISVDSNVKLFDEYRICRFVDKNWKAFTSPEVQDTIKEWEMHYQ